MFVDDEEVGTFLYDEGLRFGDPLPDHREVAGRPGEAGPAVRRSSGAASAIRTRRKSRPSRASRVVSGLRCCSRKVAVVSRVPVVPLPATLRPSLEIAVAVARGAEAPPRSHRGGTSGGPLLRQLPAPRGARGDRVGDHGAVARRRRCSGCTTPGVLAVLLPELEATVDFSQEAGRRHKDVWEHTKQVVRQSVPQPARALGGAAARHRQGADARDAPRRRRDLPPPRRGGRADVRHVAERLGFDKRRAAQDPVPDPAPPARQRLRAGLDRRGGAPLRPRDGRRTSTICSTCRAPTSPRAARAGGRRRSRNIHALKERILAIRALDARIPPLPPGLGNAIMETFSLPPSQADRRPAQALRGGRRARRARRAPRRRLLRRLPPRQDLTAGPPRGLPNSADPSAGRLRLIRSQRVRARVPCESSRFNRLVPVADAFEGLVLLPVQEVALAAAQGADLGGEEGRARDRRDHDGDQRPRAAWAAVCTGHGSNARLVTRLAMPELPDLVHVEAVLRDSAGGKDASPPRAPAIRRCCGSWCASLSRRCWSAARSSDRAARALHALRARRRPLHRRQRHAGRPLQADRRRVGDAKKKDPARAGPGASVRRTAPELQYVDDKRMGKVYVARARGRRADPRLRQAGHRSPLAGLHAGGLRQDHRQAARSGARVPDGQAARSPRSATPTPTRSCSRRGCTRRPSATSCSRRRSTRLYEAIGQRAAGGDRRDSPARTSPSTSRCATSSGARPRRQALPGLRHHHPRRPRRRRRRLLLPACQPATRKLFVAWSKLSSSGAWQRPQPRRAEVDASKARSSFALSYRRAKRNNAAAVATLSESAPGDMGIVTRWSQAARAAGERPGPSAPNSSATRAGRREVGQRNCVRVEHRADHDTPSSRSVADRRASGRGARSAR